MYTHGLHPYGNGRAQGPERSLMVLPYFGEVTRLGAREGGWGLGDRRKRSEEEKSPVNGTYTSTGKAGPF